VLIHFVSNPWTLCTRDALAEALYGLSPPDQRARGGRHSSRGCAKRIVASAVPAAQRLIKTNSARLTFLWRMFRSAHARARAVAPALEARTA